MRRRLTVTLAALLCVGTALPALAQGTGLTITWGEDDSATRLFDPRVTQSRHESQLIVQVFDTLIGSDENAAYFPGLAKSWEMAPDGLSIVLHLRDDVTFHDGTKFNAEAVKFNFDSIVDPKLGSQAAIDLLGPYAGTDVLDEYTVRIRYTRPYGAAIASFSQNELSPVSPSAVQRLGNDGFAANPVGTGPFRFVSWERGRQVVMERYDAYNWAPGFSQHQGPSRVQRLVHRFIPDAATRVAALERGEIDAADAVPVLDMQRLSQNRAFQTRVGNAAGLPTGAFLNTSHGPLADIKVRQALILSINRPQLVQGMFFGLIEPAFGPLSKTTPGYWPGVEEYYRFDRARAVALLEEAGWKPGPGGIRVKDGQPLSITYFVPPPMGQDVAVQMQAEAKRVGIDLKVENITFARQIELATANTYDMLPLRWINADPSLLEIPFNSRNIPQPGRYRFNLSRTADPVLDELLASGAGEVDQRKRTAIYQDVQKRIMDAAIWMPIYNQVQTVAWRSNRTGYRLARAQWMLRFYEVQEAR
ncbi:ABC transporter substrate-binding protein [Roseomonas sp. OT10]|uniref:ABC transporter substrate-binding protein n=1 Tax=Roseomonas cutis TaxID=2897332 RepID=UPI001E365BA9|nr:ABC transporter substrate-binding protein [Roseomonas sp. OT10]UFN48466.1 ABC transporter substrate-binding protein [Roseomonas sp. OT10]